MTHDGIAKVQHYVPQFLLKHFSTGKKNKVHVFDKQTGKTFLTNVKISPQNQDSMIPDHGTRFEYREKTNCN
jgi:phospholipase C